MVNYEGANGGVLNVTMSRNYAKGAFWAKGALAGMCLDSYANGQLGAVQTQGVVNAVPFGGQTAAVAVGDKLYTTDGATNVNKTASGGRVAVGVALSAKASSNSGTVDVFLLPGIA